MPTWSGWEFPNIKKHIKIYMLASPVDPADHQQAEENKYVAGYIELNVLSILEEQRVGLKE